MLFSALSLWSTVILLVSASKSDQNYSEGLFIKHLPDGRVLATFDFVTSWDVSPVTFAQPSFEHHYGIFPKSLAEIVSHFGVQELHLSLTQGKWRTRMWGYPPSPAPPGAELWAWFLPFTEAESKWPGLVNALSGIVCAHLNDIGPPSTYQPHYSFRPRGAVIGNLTSSQLQYAALPRETVCTENFTPWTKLLPCGSTAGLSTLFSVLKLYDSDYHSLSLHFVPTCQDDLCLKVGVHLRQSLTVVFQPMLKNGHVEWTFSSLFSRPLVNSCPLASVSRVVLESELSSGEPVLLTAPAPSSVVEQMGAAGEKNSHRWMVYDVENGTRYGKLDLSVKSKVKVYQGMPQPPLLTVYRSLKGSGHEWGGLHTEISNHHPDSEINLVYLDMIPWFCRVYIHTLAIENATVLSRHYQPAKDRQKPQMLEMLLRIPPSTSASISFQFNRAFLKWTEHPPDAHHGFYINSAVVTAVVPECNNCTITLDQLSRSSIKDIKSDAVLRLHTELLLISLPTPDFSMPYNVICFVCTVIAIGFGSIFNLTTRRLIPASEDDKGLVGKLIFHVKAWLNKKKSLAICKHIKETDKVSGSKKIT